MLALTVALKNVREGKPKFMYKLTRLLKVK